MLWYLWSKYLGVGWIIWFNLQATSKLLSKVIVPFPTLSPAVYESSSHSTSFQHVVWSVL